METNRNLANVGRKVNVSGQNLQHFVSNSPWSARSLIEAIQDDIKVHPAFQEAILVLDESAEEKSGPESAGAGRQHNGRLGKIEMSQVGVFLSLVTPSVNTWIDGETLKSSAVRFGLISRSTGLFRRKSDTRYKHPAAEP